MARGLQSSGRMTDTFTAFLDPAALGIVAGGTALATVLRTPAREPGREQRDPARTPVADVMTTELFCCTPETSIEEARGVMKNRRVRHLPLVDGDRRLQGLISIGDLNAAQSHDQEQTIYLLHEYINGYV